MRGRFAATITLLVLGACDGASEAHERYVAARKSYGEVQARTFDPACSEEPTCSLLLETLEAIPQGHRDRSESEGLLARIRGAREEKASEAARRAAVARATAEGLEAGPSADLPIFDADEVPAFLRAPRGGKRASQGGRAREGVDARTRPTDGDDAHAGDRATVSSEITEPPHAAASAEKAPGESLFGTGPADPCVGKRVAIAERKNYLARTAAERDTFAYVEDPEDAAALRLLQRMQRCEAQPADPDCAPPPIEVDISDLEMEPHEISFEPSELNAGERTPDELTHDPVLRDLLRALKRCEAQDVHQPLLQPAKRRAR